MLNTRLLQDNTTTWVKQPDNLGRQAKVEHQRVESKTKNFEQQSQRQRPFLFRLSRHQPKLSILTSISRPSTLVPLNIPGHALRIINFRSTIDHLPINYQLSTTCWQNNQISVNVGGLWVFWLPWWRHNVISNIIVEMSLRSVAAFKEKQSAVIEVTVSPLCGRPTRK